MGTRLIATLLAFATLASAQSASPELRKGLASIDASAPQAIDLLEKMVNINSGSFNTAGVKAVADLMAAELRALGFEVTLLPNDVRKRGPHLSARLKGTRPAKPLLLIGHMDTVFEPSSPFQRFVRNGSTATGPGVNDMKGGLVVMLSALKGLRTAGLLEGANLEIFLTGDEEAPGDPVEAAREALIEAGKRSHATLCFETGRVENGSDWISTARRGFLGWELRSKGKAGHSGRIFSPERGHGAIFELSRIINTFHAQLPEPNMTFNVGLMLGGADAKASPDGASTVQGKSNIVASEALARGEVRALSLEQVNRVKDKMQGIVAKSLPGTSSQITFGESYPPMAPSAGNRRLLALLNKVSAEAGIPQVKELDPMERGAGDVSFVAPFTDALTGLGAIGSGAHAEGESVDLESLPRVTKRAAALIYALTR
jgi:glutamate carboxypeptidase